ncbi:tyrosine-type recombinase/integrase [Aerococcus viridans]|uniref:tyrosine-type recombinase/integrase n=1 Tax=Aerococcus viridans TaxID=1377 RepID=UPI003CC823BF
MGNPSLNHRYRKGFYSLFKNFATEPFRHTYVSLAVEQGIDKDTIAKQVGHANTKMIDNIYLHVTDKIEQDIGEKLYSFQI